MEPLVYFSNGPADFPTKGRKLTPLFSNERFLGIQWGPRTLQPGQGEVYMLAVGMASYDPVTGRPVKPEIILQ